MNKSKMLLSLFGATVTATTFTGCAMCKMPIKDDASCIEPTHIASIKLNPENVTYVQPKPRPVPMFSSPLLKPAPSVFP